jgi:hypothetical protein
MVSDNGDKIVENIFSISNINLNFFIFQKLPREIAALLITVLFSPSVVLGQLSQIMTYKVINGQLYVPPPPTTAAPGILETLFPFLGTSYQSSNPVEVDEAIINSVSGPPASSGFSASASGVLNLPSFSSYPQQQGLGTNQIASPYLGPGDDEDAYASSDSINQYQYAMPPNNIPQMSGYPSQNSFYNYQSYQNGYPNPTYAASFPTPIPSFPTTEKPAPFYQPILNFFGWGNSAEPSEEDYANMLPSPADLMNMGSFPSESIPQIPQNQHYYAPVQARQSADMASKKYPPAPNTARKYSVTGSPKADAEAADLTPEDSMKDGDSNTISSTETSSDENKDKDKFPCPKLGFWQYDGVFCIPVGNLPAWGCKPNDLAVSGKIAVCRRKFFLSQGAQSLRK